MKLCVENSSGGVLNITEQKKHKAIIWVEIKSSWLEACNQAAQSPHAQSPHLNMMIQSLFH